MNMFPGNTPANDIIHMAAALLTAHASNPNTTLPTEKLPDVLRQIHSVVAELARSDADAGLSIPGGGLRTSPALPSPAPAPRATAPAPLQAPAPSEKAPAPLAGSAVFAKGEAPDAGEHLDGQIWPSASAEQRAKFRALIKEFNIQVDLNGRPIPRKRIEALISPDGLMVADPIGGEYFKMLKRHLSVAYGLTHEELLMMYNLTSEQLPRTGPVYSDSKRLQASAMGLGKRDGLGRGRKEKKAANG